MRGEADEELVKKRLQELAQRSAQLWQACFTGFLSPPEAEWAGIAARCAGVSVGFCGGYEGAERQIARFSPDPDEAEPYPITALELSWPHQEAPAHRDILGSVMALGLERRCVGDIALQEERAYLFVLPAMAAHISEQLQSAGRIKLRVQPAAEPLQGAAAEGKELRDTVASPRLDAVVGSGFQLSRAKAAELIRAGRVKLKYLPNDHTDAQVAQGDAISVRGLGRLIVTQIGQPTKKGRYPLLMLRYGDKRSSSINRNGK